MSVLVHVLGLGCIFFNPSLLYLESWIGLGKECWCMSE